VVLANSATAEATVLIRDNFMLPMQQGCGMSLVPKETVSRIKHLLVSFAVYCCKQDRKQAL